MDSLLEKASEKQERHEPRGLRRKMVPATNVPEWPIPFFDNCDYTETLCNSQGFDIVYGCCPFAGAVCCPDLRTCCPGGMECITTTGPMCAGNRSIMVRKHFRFLISVLSTLLSRQEGLTYYNAWLEGLEDSFASWT